MGEFDQDEEQDWDCWRNIGLAILKPYFVDIEILSSDLFVFHCR